MVLPAPPRSLPSRIAPTNRPRRIAPGLRGLAAPVLLLGLGACGGHDPIDTPVTWWHQLQGGVIAEQRPPPPGVDAPYPRIGTTPAKAPTIVSADLRRSVTEQLEQQRNLSGRLNAENPLPPPAAPPPPRITPPAPAPAAAGDAAAPAPANQSSAVLDAVEAPPNPTVAAARTGPAALPSAATPPGADPGELAMPAVAAAATPQPSAPIPAIAQDPPTSPALPGLSAPPGPSYVAPAHPNFDLAEGRGELLFFPAGSDALDAGQDGTLRALAGDRRDGTIVVHGYGDAASDAPADQAAAIALASLRARSVAAALQRDGVPARAIRLTADAFGRGARAELLD